MFWWALPVAIGGLAAAVVGCTEASARPPHPNAETLAVYGARFPIASAQRGASAERHERAARGASMFAASTGLLPSIGSTTAETPLEQLLREGDRPLANNGLCPPDMASIDDRFCVDRFEASLVEVLPSGDERPWSPFQGMEGHVVRAVSERGVMPQGYVSGAQAAEACGRSGKRLCKPSEWRTACKGPEKNVYGYGNANQAGRCNDHGRGPVIALYGQQLEAGGQREWNFEKMNDPQLNQLSGTLAATGSHDGCTNGYGVYDMVGNLHEWVADPAGTFQGGYYQDTHINGDGCDYKTMAHEFRYHDYSTGFRCCADPAP